MPVCKGCGAEILWATTINGKKIPLDPEPDPLRGAVFYDGVQAIVLRAAARKEALAEGEPLYTAHWSTCARAAHYRKGRRANADQTNTA